MAWITRIRNEQQKNTSDVRFVKLDRRVSPSEERRILLERPRRSRNTQGHLNKLSQWRLHGVLGGWSGDQLCLVTARQWMEVVKAPRQKLGWVVRAIPPSEGFCHAIELDDQKIVTLSRYLYQHARPMSEVIPDPWKWIPKARAQNGQNTAGGTD